MPEALDVGEGPRPRDLATAAAVPAPDDGAALLAVLARDVLDVPGVLRLEPTLSTAGPRVLLHRSASDGITLLTRGGVAEVDVNVSTHGDRSARAVARGVQACVAGTLDSLGYRHDRVTVCVLSIDPPPGPAGPSATGGS